jgi:hypothetical protein
MIALGHRKKQRKEVATMTTTTIKCNHFFCVGKSYWDKRNATTLVNFAGTEAVRPHDTYCCGDCFMAYSPVIKRNPERYTVTEL